MNKIEICIVEPDSIEQRQQIIEGIIKSSFDLEIGSLKSQTDESGKPRLRSIGGDEIFYSFSHARKVDQPFGIGAISWDTEVGIDVELWPTGHADPDFLKAISTKEDEAAMAILNLRKHDSGIALWVIKEAALKCTGEVMIDPRYLAVTYQGAGTFLVQSSALAGAPHPDIRVRLFVLRGSHLPHEQFVIGISMSAGCDAGVVTKNALWSANQRWQIEDFETARPF